MACDLALVDKVFCHTLLVRVSYNIAYLETFLEWRIPLLYWQEVVDRTTHVLHHTTTYTALTTPAITSTTEKAIR